MSRYIDAEKIKYTEYINGDVTVSKDLVEKIPTADVQEVRHGKWIVCGTFDDLVKCSCCGYRDTRNHVIYENLMYCGKCGAIMDEEEQQ